MSRWKPRNETPDAVGRYVYRNLVTHEEFPAQWDGRHFRYVNGLEAGSVVMEVDEDEWRPECKR